MGLWERNLFALNIIHNTLLLVKYCTLQIFFMKQCNSYYTDFTKSNTIKGRFCALYVDAIANSSFDNFGSSEFVWSIVHSASAHSDLIGAI